MLLINKNEHAGVTMAENCMIAVTLVSMGPLAEWGPGQITPVAPLSAALCMYDINTVP